MMIVMRSSERLNDFDAKAPKAVYLFDRTQGNDPHMDFVCTDKTASQSVRFRHFMQDCRAIAGDSRDLDLLIAQERQAVPPYLDQAYQDILDTFDPKLAKFRKKYKIVVADRAWKHLM